MSSGTFEGFSRTSVEAVSRHREVPRRSRLIAAVFGGLATSLIALSANADVILSGSAFPSALTTNPTTTNQINIGFSGAGSLEINANAATNGFTTVTGNFSGSTGAVIGSAVGGTGTVLISGNGTAGSATLTTSGGIIAGSGGGTGFLTVQNGGLAQATGAGSGIQAGNSNSTGSITVDGANSALSTGSRIRIGGFTSSVGTLTVSNGAEVQTGTNVGFSDGMVEIGTGDGATGTATVTGATSTLGTKGLIVGSSDVAGTITNTGTLTIQNGGTVTADTGAVSVGSKAGSQITVTGTGSTLEISPILAGFFAGKELLVGGFGQGTLLVDQNATVNAAGANILVGGGLFGANTDAATLTVANGGTVTANTVFVNQGGTLNGNGGTINANVTLNGGTLAPGASPGVMDIDGNLLMTSGLLQLEIGTLLSDLLNVTGNVTFGAGLDIDLVFGITPATGQLFDLASFFAGSSSLIFDPAFDLEGQLNILGLSDTSFITVALGGETVTFGQQPPNGQVPEPASLALFGAALLGLGVLRRRRAA